MTAPWWNIVARVLEALQTPVQPKEVDAALSESYDLEAYHKNHGGEAPPDAPHIDDDGTL